MRWKSVIALALPLAVPSICKAQAARPSQAHNVTVVLHDFYRPTLVTLTVGSRVLFRDTVKSDPSTAIASWITVYLRSRDKVCVSYSGRQHCRTVTASDLSKRFLLVSAETRLSPFAMKFFDKLMFD